MLRMNAQMQLNCCLHNVTGTKSLITDFAPYFSISFSSSSSRASVSVLSRRGGGTGCCGLWPTFSELVAWKQRWFTIDDNNNSGKLPRSSGLSDASPSFSVFPRPRWAVPAGLIPQRCVRPFLNYFNSKFSESSKIKTRRVASIEAESGTRDPWLLDGEVLRKYWIGYLAHFFLFFFNNSPCLSFFVRESSAGNDRPICSFYSAK